MSDESGRFELTRRRLLGSVAVTGAATAGAGAGTWAYFTDSETSSGNEVSAGTLDLGITDGGSIEWTITDGVPGGPNSWDDQDVHLYNTGTIEADHVELDFENHPSEDDDGDLGTGASYGPESDPTDGASGMAEYVRVNKLAYQDTGGNVVLTLVSNGQPVDNSGRPDVQDVNGNGYVDLDDLAATENEDALDNITPVPPAGGSDSDSSTQTTVTIEVEVASGMTNDYQGDVLTTEVTFSLQQAADGNN